MNPIPPAGIPLRGLTPPGYLLLQLGTGSNAAIAQIHDMGGGSIFADVLVDTSGPLSYAQKRIGPARYEDILISIGTTLPDSVFDWIAGSWTSQPMASDGAILAVNGNFQVKSELVFTGASISETTFPALDAASKDPGFLQIRLTPTLLEFRPGSGATVPFGLKQKPWQASHFRLDVAGLDCTRVSRIEPLTMTRTGGKDGGSPVSDSTGGKVLFPDLKVTLAATSMAPWKAWLEDFVVKGNNGDAFERTGSITFVGADLKTPLSRIDLHRIGIVSLTPLKSPDPQIARVVAELYCEEMVWTRTPTNP